MRRRMPCARKREGEKQEMNFTFRRIPMLQKKNCSGIFRYARSVRVTPLTNETGAPAGCCAAPGQCPNSRRARLSMHRPSVVDRLPRTPCSPEYTLIVVVGPHARTRGGRGCRPHGLCLLSAFRTLFRLPTLYPLLGVEEGISRIYRTWALDVSDDRSGLVVHELDADLGDTTTRTYPSSSQKFVHSFVSTASERASEYCVAWILLPRYQVSWGKRRNAPVRPSTRVTLTSLTGCLEESIIAT